MTALANKKQSSHERWGYHRFTLSAGTRAYDNGAACLDLATGEVVPAVSGMGLLFIGTFAESVDATLAAKTVNVRLGLEKELEWWANGSAIVATDAGKLCFFEDDATVSLLPVGAVAGRIWAVGIDGVLVEKLPHVAEASPAFAAPAFAANDSVLAAVVHGGVYDIQATAAASTVTLPADPPDGIEATFVADGTKNAHTVTYRDVTGPVSLTTALAADQRHIVKVVSAGGIWHASAGVSPAP